MRQARDRQCPPYSYHYNLFPHSYPKPKITLYSLLGIKLCCQLKNLSKLPRVRFHDFSPRLVCKLEIITELIEKVL